MDNRLTTMSSGAKRLLPTQKLDVAPRHRRDEGLGLRLLGIMMMVSLLTFGSLVTLYELIV